MTIPKFNIITNKTDLDQIDFISGATLLINKPLNWTSFDVVGKLRNLLRTKYQIKKIKVGHAGTLDPLATGLLIVCTGKSTKKIDQLQGMEKDYRAKIKLGAVTASYDREMVEEEKKDTGHINIQEVVDAAMSFRGESKQIPPMYSALKKNGKPLYKFAREGKVIKRDPRTIFVHDVGFIGFMNPFLELDLKVSKGTYIRTIANDLGNQLGVGGYLDGLVRTAIGPYKLSDALEVTELIEKLKPQPQV